MTRKMPSGEHPLQQASLQDKDGRRLDAAARARRLAKQQADAMPAVGPVQGPRLQRVVDAELTSPAAAGGIIGVLRQPYLLKLLVGREIAQMYSASLLGLLWSYVQPAIRFSVYYLIFGVLLNAHKSVPNFAIHLFCGIVFVSYFSEAFGGGTRSIWSNRALVKKMSMPREIFPVSQMVVAGIHTFPQIVLLGFFCALSGFTTDLTGLASLVLGMLIIGLFAGALGMLFSAINVYYRDFQNIVGTITQFMHFLVPMMYPITTVMSKAQGHPVLYQIYLANPVAEGVILVQRFFWHGVNQANRAGLSRAELRGGRFPEHLLLRGVITLLFCIAFLWVCQKVFSRLEPKFPERL